MKQIKIRIFPDGRIESETVNIKGKKCLEYIKPIQEMTGAQAIDSEFTDEYYENETEELQTNIDYERAGTE